MVTPAFPPGNNSNRPALNKVGKKVGEYVGNRLVKKVRYSKHFFRMHGGWSTDTFVLDDAEENGVKYVEVYDVERKKAYSAKISDHRLHGKSFFQKDTGAQLCLPITYWVEIPYPGTPKKSKGPSRIN